MPYNPAGLFSLVASYFASPGASIRTEQHNPVFEDVAAALSSVYLRDGRAPMTGDVNMNGFAINNVVAGNSLSSVATLAQSMPIGAVIDFAGTSPPPGWMLCYGQALSRTTYATLFAWLGTTYGVGDGSTTFNLPDLRGRVIAAPDAMGGAAANRLTPSYFGSTAQGAAGGADNQVLTLAQVPQGINSAGVNSILVTSGANKFPLSSGTIFPSGSGTDGSPNSSPAQSGGSAWAGGNSMNNPTQSIAVQSNNTGGAPHTIVQPTFILPKIIRVSYDV